MIRTRGLAPSQKTILFNLAQNIMTNGERLFRTKLKENSNCGSCGEAPDDKHHMFACSNFPKTSSGLQNLLNHVTGKPFNMENLANLDVELEDASLQLPFTFLLAEIVKSLTAQCGGNKRENLTSMKANILAKASFLQQIPNLAYAYTVIDMWLTNFFASPLHDPSVLTGANPPPSTNLAIGAGGENPGVLGKKQTHLITSFFHATPKRGRPPDTLATHEESLPSNKGSKGTAASSLPTNLTKLVHQQNWPSQAEPRSQCTQAAATTTTPPASQAGQ